MKQILTDKNFFGITNETLFDNKKIKVITGIAGSAKSSNIDKIFKENGIEYYRFTSTNKLKNDAEKRYGQKSYTIAGGLFTSKNGKFFIDEKEIDAKHIVIDEILQTDSRVLDFCINNVGKINIIITTDFNQMLVQDRGEYFLKKFKEFCQRDDVLHIELKKTYRARDKETEELYYELYNSVDKKENQFRKMKNKFEYIDFLELDFNKNDIYICHTNDIEEQLYNQFQISARRDLDFILKGSIASKQVKDINKYPILCQNQLKSKNMIAYLQPSNIASATRYQGSEVHENQKLYFLVNEKSYVSNREFYTVLSRCYNMKSLVVVYVTQATNEEIKEYFGKHVKKHQIAEIKENLKLSDGQTLEEAMKNKEGKKLLLSNEDFEKIKKTIKNTEDIEYDSDFIRFHNTFITSGKGNEEKEEQNKLKKGKFTIQSLLKKEGQFDYNYMNEIYRIFEKNEIDHFHYAHSKSTSHKKKETTRYELDLYSAYPHILANSRLPIRGNLCRFENPENLNFYIYEGDTYLREGTIITDDLKNFLEKFEPGKFRFIFGTGYVMGCQMGRFLHEKSHRSAETKAEVKQMRYGYMQKQYLGGRRTVCYGSGKRDWKSREISEYYVLNTSNKYEILMAAICSELCFIMMTIQYYIYGNLTDGTIIVDAVHFNASEEQIEEIFNYASKLFPEFDFRILDKENGDQILFKTYETLKTRKELEAEKKRRYKQRQREKKQQELAEN